MRDKLIKLKKSCDYMGACVGEGKMSFDQGRKYAYEYIVKELDKILGLDDKDNLPTEEVSSLKPPLGVLPRKKASELRLKGALLHQEVLMEAKKTEREGMSTLKTGISSLIIE